MKHLRNPYLIAGLLIGFLIMGGILATQSFAHSVHHGHHQAQTHANPLCSLICAAGQGIQLIELLIEKPFSPLITIQQEQFSPRNTPLVVPLFDSRAPPFPHQLS